MQIISILLQRFKPYKLRFLTKLIIALHVLTFTGHAQVVSLKWDENYGNEFDEARALLTISEQNLLLIGNTESTDFDISYNNGGSDVWLCKIDTSRNLLWEKSFGVQVLIILSRQ